MDDDAKGGISPAEFQKGMLEFNNTNVSDEAAASLFEYYSASGGPKVRSAANNHSQPLARKRSLPQCCRDDFVSDEMLPWCLATLCDALMLVWSDS